MARRHWHVCKTSTVFVSLNRLKTFLAKLLVQFTQSVFLLSPVFSGVMFTSSLAHYLRSGKDPVILSILSLSLVLPVLGRERRAGREKKREGWNCRSWGLGNEKKTRPGKKRRESWKSEGQQNQQQRLLILEAPEHHSTGAALPVTEVELSRRLGLLQVLHFQKQ